MVDRSSSGSARRRRRATTDELVTIFWRDIPAQVTATVAGTKGSWLLDRRFQNAIDRAAGVAGLTAAEDYVRQWRRSTVPTAGDPELVARSAAEALEQRYTARRLHELVRNGGLEPHSARATAHDPAHDPEREDA